MNLETIERIESQLAEIDDEIRRLELEKDNVINSDEEYSGYLDAYQSYYDDEPLSIRQYYERTKELETISRKCTNENVEEWVKEYGKRVQQLERMLAA